VSALEEQLAYLEASSAFYRERLRGVRERVRTPADLRRLPLVTKEELRESQRRDPPFGEHLCAPRERLVRMHVTSGTTGEPVAVGFTRRDHEANSAVGGEAFRIAGVRPDDTVAHCLNYALYAGGIADHMALEASGATVVPVGTGRSVMSQVLCMHPLRADGRRRALQHRLQASCRPDPVADHARGTSRFRTPLSFWDRVARARRAF